MLNEHHQTADLHRCRARRCRPRSWRGRPSKARICILGNPIANRGDPIRIAEEMAMIDCISRGRLDVGFVRGVPYEIFAANTNPTQTNERLWEGVDLAMQGLDHARRAVQLTRAASRIAARSISGRGPISSRIRRSGSPDRATSRTISKVAERGYRVRDLPAAATTRCARCSTPIASTIVDHGLPGGGGIAFMPLVYTADSEAEAERGARGTALVLQSAKAEPQFSNPPGYVPVIVQREGAARAHSPAAPTAMRAQGLDYLRSRAS